MLELQLEPAANAGHDLNTHMLALINDAGVTNFDFIGNERYGQFRGG